ncbi:hypothetical protein [Psychromonas antarctica]|nr:hypothetical protein [Psychromonas antarctica]MCG6202684.1 hypothetical protein [Psychromonas antarctica]
MEAFQAINYVNPLSTEVNTSIYPNIVDLLSNPATQACSLHLHYLQI